MAYRIEISGIGKIDMSKEESTAIGSLLTTKSTDSGSAEKSAIALGGLAYAEALNVLPADSVVTLFEKPEGKKEEKVRAEYTVKALTNRVKAAATQAERQGKIFAYDTTEATEDKPEEVKPVASWLKNLPAKQ
jgi:hypothetical protein